jgi:hypothetical protein
MPCWQAIEKIDEMMDAVALFFLPLQKRMILLIKFSKKREEIYFSLIYCGLQRMSLSHI